MTAHKLIFLIVMGLYLAGFLIPFLFSKHKGISHLSLLLALVASGVGGYWMGNFWLSASLVTEPIELWRTKWFVGTLLHADLPNMVWEIQIDALAAFYGFIITAFAVVVSLYSFNALSAPHYEQQKGRIASAFNLFVGSTLMVVLVSDIFSLIVALEIMTLSFGYLAMYKHLLYQNAPHQKESELYRAKVAPQVYMIINHASTTFLLVALLLLAIQANSMSFAAISEAKTTLSVLQSNTIFLFTLVGLGIRAGLSPSHVWVPIVHPASPTTTHAFSLGIAIKVAIYLMIRFFFQFLPVQWWWGYVVILLAVFTAVINVWYAIVSHDLKTALAYHSIENVGIIVAGVGVALLFLGRPDQVTVAQSNTLVMLGLAASFYHTLNHAVFKGLLYLATGAIDNLTNQVVSFNKLGGLIKLYPFTSAMFLVGAVSIAGFPPFNGFVSEWLTVRALLDGAFVLSKRPVPLAIILCALILLAAAFALTAFCFFKMVGLALMGQPRSSSADRQNWQTHDVPWFMKSTMGMMALLCLLLGIFPKPVYEAMLQVTAVVYPLPNDTMLAWQDLSPLDMDNNPMREQPIEMRALFLFSLFVVGGILLLRRNKRVQSVPIPWNCGTLYHPAHMQPTSSSLSYMLRDTMNQRNMQTENPPPDYLPATIYVSHSTAFPQTMIEWFRHSINILIAWSLTRSTSIGKRLQNKDIRRYLSYIFIANIVAILLFLCIWVLL